MKPWLQEAKADPTVYVNGSDMMFVTWFATGGHGDGGFSTHQFATPDMRWIDVVRKSHPGCSVAYVLDQDTQLETYEGLDVHRLPLALHSGLMNYCCDHYVPFSC